MYTTDEELSSEVVTAFISMAQGYPGVEILGNPDSHYNCHSYAWYSESIYNPYWIVDVEMYVDDAHSVLRKKTEPVQVGDICIYIKDNQMVHSAVVERIEGDTIICCSKWGQSVLCEHPISSVPEAYLESSVALYLVVDITPHEWTYESAGINGHTATCTICGYEKVSNCVYEYTYLYDDMHNVHCKYCDNGYSGAFCTFSYSSNGDGTHTGVCACGNTSTVSCYWEYTTNGNAWHSASCVVCGNSYMEQCTTTCTYSGTVGTHNVVCTFCGYSETDSCTLVYVYDGEVNGQKTHIRVCENCDYSAGMAVNCVFGSDGTCRFCGAPEWSDILQRIGEGMTGA